VVHLHYFDGYDYSETAELLNLSVSAVRSRLERARCILRKELCDMEPASTAVWELNDRDLNALRAAATIAAGYHPDNNLPLLNSILLDNKGNLVSTDTHRLFCYNRSWEGKAPCALIHADLGRALRDAHPQAQNARLRIEDAQAKLQLDTGDEIQAPIVEGDYPKWEKVIPEAWEYQATSSYADWVNCLEMLSQQESTASVNNNNHRMMISLAPGDGRIMLRRCQLPAEDNDIAWELSVWLPASFSAGSSELDIAMNLAYLQQAINGLDLGSDEPVELCATSHDLPVIVRPAQEGNVLVVTMPMKYEPPSESE
jgi:DNA polymerase III sliding clamp (beta) subunit (PCNA family)